MTVPHLCGTCRAELRMSPPSPLPSPSPIPPPLESHWNHTGITTGIRPNAEPSFECRRPARYPRPRPSRRRWNPTGITTGIRREIDGKARGEQRGGVVGAPCWYAVWCYIRCMCTPPLSLFIGAPVQLVCLFSSFLTFHLLYFLPVHASSLSLYRGTCAACLSKMGGTSGHPAPSPSMLGGGGNGPADGVPRGVGAATG